jgi:hypothetical protein
MLHVPHARFAAVKRGLSLVMMISRRSELAHTAAILRDCLRGADDVAVERARRDST